MKTAIIATNYKNAAQVLPTPVRLQKNINSTKSKCLLPASPVYHTVAQKARRKGLYAQK